MLLLMLTNRAQFTALNGTARFRFDPPIVAMHGFLDVYTAWIENSIGCPRGAARILEISVPFNDLATAELLPEVLLPQERRVAADRIRHFMTRCELPPAGGVRLQIEPVRVCHDRDVVWNAIWKETPVGFWFRSMRYGAVWANIPFVSFRRGGPETEWKSWLIVHPSDANAAMAMLGKFVVEEPKTMSVEGGSDVPLSERDYDWNRIVLDPALQGAIKIDFETFLKRRDWFVDNHLPYKRGYLLYGPPGNGKTSVVRAMVCHPGVSAYSIDFGSPYASNASLTKLFEKAALNSPSVIVLEDLDRSFCEKSEDERAVDLSHLLNCLDGLQSRAGIIVVATANEIRRLDPALLRRPGRFDRMIQFGNPAHSGRREYFARFTIPLDADSVERLAALSDGFSFAQLRETYVLAGQAAFLRGSNIAVADLEQGILDVRSQFARVGRKLAFPGSSRGGDGGK